MRLLIFISTHLPNLPLILIHHLHYPKESDYFMHPHLPLLFLIIFTKGPFLFRSISPRWVQVHLCSWIIKLEYLDLRCLISMVLSRVIMVRRLKWMLLYFSQGFKSFIFEEGASFLAIRAYSPLFSLNLLN